MRWYLSRKARDLTIRADSLLALSSARKVFKNVELSHTLGLSEAALSKYYHGITVPATPMAERLLSVLMSDEFAKKYVGRFMNKIGWDLRKAFTEPQFINFVSMYLKYKLMDKLPGLFVNKFLSLPDYSMSIASYLSVSLEIPLVITAEENSIIGLEARGRSYTALQKGDYVISIHAILNNEIAEYFSYLVEAYNLKYVMALSLILMDEDRVSEILKSPKIYYLIP
ncbi:MAG: hypothetical protein QW705_03635 [Zestosphaera sp.]